MSHSNLERLRVEALRLGATDRAALARELLASLTESPESMTFESEFRRRMKSYIERSWTIASNSLTVRRDARTRD